MPYFFRNGIIQGIRPYLLKKRGSIWYFRRENEKTFHSTSQRSKGQAARWVLRLLGHRLAGGKVPTIREYTEDFFVWDRCPWVRAQLSMHRRISKATAKMRRSHLINYIWPRWGTSPLDEPTPLGIRDWLVGLELAGQTKNHLRYTMSIVYDQMVLDKILEVNPMDLVPAFGGGNCHHDAFTSAELRKLFPFDAAKLVEIWREARWAAMHYLMITTGMRLGEAAGLTWRHVNLPQYSVVIRLAVKADGRIGPPKNEEARAAIFPRRTRAVLVWWRQQTPLKGLDDFVFPGNYGRHLNTKTVQRVLTGRTVKKKRFPGVLERVGINCKGRSLSCHSLRVTYNTMMRPLLPEGVLQYIMGHKSRTMTEIYDGSAPEERIETLLRPSRQQIEQAWN